jgi:hypothetical protein
MRADYADVGHNRGGQPRGARLITAHRPAVAGGNPTSGRASSTVTERAICADRIVGRRPTLPMSVYLSAA